MTVFYRRWRPQTLADVVGQEPITRTLGQALATGRVAHAYLFAGPRGTGKTSTGRILAKALNCQGNGRGEPCNACDLCQAMNEGRALDLVEIDAASNRGIEEIRDLREKVQFAPTQGRYKVYIVDEVHMLTNEAFNALLKTLEEPPPYVVFVLATTEPHKVPATIISRCQRFDFRRISHQALMGKLQQICQGESIRAVPQALALIAQASAGSLRDAENLLEQLAISHNSEVGVAQAQAALGITGDPRVGELVQHLLSGNVAAGLATIAAVTRDGLDLRQFHRELVECLRGLLRAKAGAEGDGPEPPPWKVAAPEVSLERLAQALKLLGEVDFRWEVPSPLPLEMALVEMSLTGTAKASPRAEVPPLPERPEPPPARPAGGMTPPPARPPTGIPSPPARPPTEARPAAPRGPQGEVVAPAGQTLLEHLRLNWRKVMAPEQVGRTNLAATLRSCRLVGLEGDTIILEARGANLDFIDKPENRREAEEVLSRILGHRYRLRCQEAQPRPRASPALGPAPAPSPDAMIQTALGLGARVVPSDTYGEEP